MNRAEYYQTILAVCLFFVLYSALTRNPLFAIIALVTLLTAITLDEGDMR